MTKLQWTGLTVLAGGLAAGLFLNPAKKESPRPAAKAPTVDTRARELELPPGAVPLFAPRADFRLAIFHLPQPKAPVRAKLDDLLSGAFKELPVVDDPKEGAPLPYLSVRSVPVEKYPLPQAEDLDYAARKLSPAARGALPSSREVTVVHVHTAPPALGLMRQAHALVLELAQQTGGVIWDEQTGHLFEPADWKAQRLDGWSGEVPVVSRHITLHVYRNDEDKQARLVTSGMNKLGLPDLELKRVAPQLLGRMAGALNLAAQVTLETGMLPKEGELLIDVDALKHTALRESVQGTLLPNSKRKAKLTVSTGASAERVRDNRLLELSCAGYPGNVPSEQQESFITELYGSSDEATPLVHDEEMAALSRKQVEKLKRELKPRFQKGLEPSQQLMVKAPFETSSGGIEWMWLVVERWEGTTLHGILNNEPNEVPRLRAGSPVTVKEEDLSDYILDGPNGRREGNETGKLKMKRLGKQQPE